MINLILSGGSGTRMWPLSRRFYPKQYSPLFNGESLFQKTIHRNNELCNSYLVVTNVSQFELAKESFSNEKVSYVLETVARNTAPAIALACMLLDREEVVFVTPSDHIITNQTNYINAVSRAEKLAQEEFLVTFGIKPTYPETGFGYIESSGEDVLAFKEKPDELTAKRYVESGNYFWNSGMFCFKVGTFLDELKLHCLDVFTACENAITGFAKSDVFTVPVDKMSLIPSISIDYGIMERSKKVKIVPADLGWSDLGSFDSLYQYFDKDKSQNVIRSDSEIYNSSGNLVIGGYRKIALCNLDNLIVIDTPDALLLAKMETSQDVKYIAEALSMQHSDLVLKHPWQHNQKNVETDILDLEPGYEVSIAANIGDVFVVENGHVSVHTGESWFDADMYRVAKSDFTFKNNTSNRLKILKVKW